MLNIDFGHAAAEMKSRATRQHAKSLLLEKWYGDVFDGASVRVFYRARLKLGPLTLGYAGGIEGAGRSDRRFVIGGAELPVQRNGTIAWPTRDALAELTWNDAYPREQRLWQRAGSALAWNPLVLNGPVSGAGIPPGARGYAEKLALNFGPWRLGLQRLKWGRFCGERHSLIWIEWEGSHPLQFAMVDGCVGRLRCISDAQVRCEDAVLRLGSRRLLVHETMSKGALRGLPLPVRLAGLRFLTGVETKWFAFGELQLPTGELDHGHAVFEEVVWP